MRKAITINGVDYILASDYTKDLTEILEQHRLDIEELTQPKPEQLTDDVISDIADKCCIGNNRSTGADPKTNTWTFDREGIKAIAARCAIPEGYVQTEEYLSKLYQKHVLLPYELYPETAALVCRFAAAMAEKLYVSQQKGRTGWDSPNWMNECRAMLLDHLEKGDPRDVANFCAFLWHHGESTAAPQNPVSEQDRRDAERYREALSQIADMAPATQEFDSLSIATKIAIDALDDAAIAVQKESK